MEKELAKKFPYIVQPAIEAAFTMYSRHQSGRTDKAKGGFDIPAEIPGGNQNDGDDFGITVVFRV
jgi:hypothetical protein